MFNSELKNKNLNPDYNENNIEGFCPDCWEQMMEFDTVKKLDKDREMLKDAGFSSSLPIQAQ